MVHKAVAVLALFVAGTVASGAEPTDALSIRLVRPDRQLERLIGLFEGSPTPNPAAALAAWKRASRDAQGLGKGLEAAIAALNPGMVRELRDLDQATIGLGIDPNDGRIRWYLVAPHDDGALAALTTAMALTDGGPDAPYLRMEVDRLGRPGSPLSLRVPGVLALAGSRLDLPSALGAARAGAPDPPADASHWSIALDPDALPAAGPIAQRRVTETLRASGLQRLEGKAGLTGETLELAMTGTFRVPPVGAAIDPGWVDWIPASGILAAGVFSLDPSPPAWDALFALADRVERVDPANGQLAPLRTRLTLFAIGAGIQPEVDLFPKLRGLTAFAWPDDRDGGGVGPFVVALHVADPGAAERLAGHVVPRLASAFLRRSAVAQRPDGVQRLGTVSGRPVEVAHRGSTVLIGWGDDALRAGLAAKASRDRSAAPLFRSAWGPTPPHRLGAVWPGRLRPSLLAGAPPVVWVGRNEAKATRDVVRWPELRGVIRRLLERVPLEPAFVP